MKKHYDKVDAVEYAEQLKKGAGVDRAYKIALGAVKALDVSNRANIPRGEVFYKKDRKGQESLPEKHLRSLHGFWTQVYHIIDKSLTKKGR